MDQFLQASSSYPIKNRMGNPPGAAWATSCVSISQIRIKSRWNLFLQLLYKSHQASPSDPYSECMENDSGTPWSIPSLSFMKSALQKWKMLLRLSLPIVAGFIISSLLEICGNGCGALWSKSSAFLHSTS